MEISDIQLSLKTDQDIADLLEKIAGTVLEKTENIESRLQELDCQTQSAAVSLGNASTKFQSLSDTQYMEKRVYTDDSDRLSMCSKTKVTKTLTKEEKEKQIVEDFTRSLHLALKCIEDWDSSHNVHTNSSNLPLPALIGSQDFFLKEDVGLNLYRKPSEERGLPPDKPYLSTGDTSVPKASDERTSPPSFAEKTLPPVIPQPPKEMPAGDIPTYLPQSVTPTPILNEPPKFTKDFEESFTNQKTSIFDDEVDEHFRKVQPVAPQIRSDDQSAISAVPKPRVATETESDDDLFIPAPLAKREPAKKASGVLSKDLRADLEEVLRKKDKFHGKETPTKENLSAQQVVSEPSRERAIPAIVRQSVAKKNNLFDSDSEEELFSDRARPITVATPHTSKDSAASSLSSKASETRSVASSVDACVQQKFSSIFDDDSDDDLFVQKPAFRPSPAQSKDKPNTLKTGSLFEDSEDEGVFTTKSASAASLKSVGSSTSSVEKVQTPKAVPEHPVQPTALVANRANSGSLFEDSDEELFSRKNTNAVSKSVKKPLASSAVRQSLSPSEAESAIKIKSGEVAQASTKSGSSSLMKPQPSPANSSLFGDSESESEGLFSSVKKSGEVAGVNATKSSKSSIVQTHDKTQPKFDIPVVVKSIPVSSTSPQVHPVSEIVPSVPYEKKTVIKSAGLFDSSESEDELLVSKLQKKEPKATTRNPGATSKPLKLFDSDSDEELFSPRSKPREEVCFNSKTIPTEQTTKAFIPEKGATSLMNPADDSSVDAKKYLGKASSGRESSILAVTPTSDEVLCARVTSPISDSDARTSEESVQENPATEDLCGYPSDLSKTLQQENKNQSKLLPKNRSKSVKSLFDSDSDDELFSPQGTKFTKQPGAKAAEITPYSVCEPVELPAAKGRVSAEMVSSEEGSRKKAHAFTPQSSSTTGNYMSPHSQPVKPFRKENNMPPVGEEAGNLPSVPVEGLDGDMFEDKSPSGTTFAEIALIRNLQSPLKNVDSTLDGSLKSVCAGDAIDKCSPPVVTLYGSGPTLLPTSLDSAPSINKLGFEPETPMPGNKQTLAGDPVASVTTVNFGGVSDNFADQRELPIVRGTVKDSDQTAIVLLEGEKADLCVESSSGSFIAESLPPVEPSSSDLNPALLANGSSTADSAVKKSFELSLDIDSDGDIFEGVSVNLPSNREDLSSSDEEDIFSTMSGKVMDNNNVAETKKIGKVDLSFLTKKPPKGEPIIEKKIGKLDGKLKPNLASDITRSVSLRLAGERPVIKRRERPPSASASDTDNDNNAEVVEERLVKPSQRNLTLPPLPPVMPRKPEVKIRRSQTFKEMVRNENAEISEENNVKPGNFLKALEKNCVKKTGSCSDLKSEFESVSVRQKAEEVKKQFRLSRCGSKDFEKDFLRKMSDSGSENEEGSVNPKNFLKALEKNSLQKTSSASDLVSNLESVSVRQKAAEIRSQMESRKSVVKDSFQKDFLLKMSDSGGSDTEISEECNVRPSQRNFLSALEQNKGNFRKSVILSEEFGYQADEESNVKPSARKFNPMVLRSNSMGAMSTMGSPDMLSPTKKPPIGGVALFVPVPSLVTPDDDDYRDYEEPEAKPEIEPEEEVEEDKSLSLMTRNRARIGVKRRPMSRRSRVEAARKSAIFVEHDLTFPEDTAHIDTEEKRESTPLDDPVDVAKNVEAEGQNLEAPKPEQTLAYDKEKDGGGHLATTVEESESDEDLFATPKAGSTPVASQEQDSDSDGSDIFT